MKGNFMQKRHFFHLMLLVFLFLGLASSSFAQAGATDPNPDGDDLPNSRDDCDNVAGPNYNNGCPVHEPEIPPDSDGDGTADPLDRCPNEAGDGANGGCPAGSDGTVPQATPDIIVLDPAPTDGDCVVSTAGPNTVNMRLSPAVTSGIIAILPPNEWLKVLAVFSSPSELYNDTMAGAPSPFLDFFPLTMDVNNETWYLVQKLNEPTMGWVSEAVIRFGGLCEPFNVAEKKKGGNKDQQAYLVVKMEDLMVSSYRPNGEDEDEEEGFVVITIIGVLIGMRENPDGDDSSPNDDSQADYYIDLGGLADESSGDPADSETPNVVRPDLLEEGCELSQDENGIITPSCEDGQAPSGVPICTHQELNEAGVYEEVCYEVEIPEGCVVDSSEAGLWHVTCEDQGDGVQITPIGEDEPILDISWYDDDTVAIGMLLPAVQKVREAAAR
jgi:hypothetical protein